MKRINLVAGVMAIASIFFSFNSCSSGDSSSSVPYMLLLSNGNSGNATDKPDYSLCTVGDFILKDGTILSKDSTPESDTVAAVIIRAASEDKPALGVGIVRELRAWCESGASGCSTEITALQGDESSGYMDGSDSWEKLVDDCVDLKSATAKTIETVAEKYPAFNYCRKYAAANGITGTLAKGWYLPTVAELYTIYQNKDTVDASLLKAGGDQLNNGMYWSCCQSSSYNRGAQVLSLSDGNVSGYDKDYNYVLVCSVRAFN